MSASIRFLINKSGILKDVFQLTYDRKDASLYFFLSGGCRQYKYGTFEMPQGAAKFDINCNVGYISTKVPKLSYHQSGMVKISHDNNDLRLKKVPLKDMHWNHILSVVVASVDQLKVREKARQGDIVVEGFKYDSARFIVHANSQGNIITVDVDGTFNHPDCQMTFGYKHVNQLPLNVTGAGGIILITGWMIDQSSPVSDSGLFIQGLL